MSITRSLVNSKNKSLTAQITSYFEKRLPWLCNPRSPKAITGKASFPRKTLRLVQLKGLFPVNPLYDLLVLSDCLIDYNVKRDYSILFGNGRGVIFDFLSLWKLCCDS